MKCAEHDHVNCRQLWRSDLVGDAQRVFEVPHGWWCVDCGGESYEVDAGAIKLARAKVQAASWSVRLLRNYDVLVNASGTEGAEAHKLSLAIQAAERAAKDGKRLAGLRAMGRTGWRVTEVGAATLVWFWTDVGDFDREGCAVIGVKTHTDRVCNACSVKIEPGQRCWRGDKPPQIRGFRAFRERITEYRFCEKCIAEMRREDISAPTPGELMRPRGLRLISERTS